MGQDVKTSNENPATLPLTGAELIRGVQGGNNVRFTPANILTCLSPIRIVLNGFDDTAFSNTFMQSVHVLGSIFSVVGTAAANSANEFLLNVQANVANPTNSLVPYEKAVLFVEGRTSDPGTTDIIAGGRAIIGIDARASINAGNIHGYAVGVNVNTGVLVGADGFTQGVEIDVFNEGSNHTNPDVDINSKIGLTIASFPTNPNTTAIWITGVGNTWNNGIWMTASGFASGAKYINIPGVFSINDAGVIAFTKAQNARTTVQVANPTAGTNAGSQIDCFNDSGASAAFGRFSSAFTTLGVLAGSDAFIYCPTNVSIAADGTGVIKFAAGGTTEVFRMDSKGTILANGTAIPAGGTQDVGYRFSSTAHFGVFFGSNVPSLTAAKGSLYLRSDGTTNTSRAYIATDSAGTWTAINTVA